MKFRSSIVATLSLLLAGACDSGPASSGDPNMGKTGKPGSRPGSMSSTDNRPPPGPYEPAPAGLRRLTRAQYTNAIRDLLGADVVVPPGLDADTSVSGFASIAAGLTTFSASQTEKAEDYAMRIAQQAMDPKRRDKLVSCMPAGASDDACARSFVSTFGKRAWRRPLDDEEVTRYANIAKLGAETLGDFWQGLTYALAGLLQSPHFLYRVELGTPGGKPAVRTFDDWELGTRLSFLLWNTTPDDALLAAAGAGELSKPAGLEAQAERLLASPRAREAVKTFFSELLTLQALDDLPQSPMIFPQLTTTLGPAMRQETLLVMEDTVFGEGGGDFRGAFTTLNTFVNRELATLYGLLVKAADNTFQRATLPMEGKRIGLLGHGSFLALNAHERTTSPTLRGKFIRESLLCQSIPAPPPDVETSLPEDSKTEPVTMREKLQAHGAPACVACHSLMDPLGLAFENFDAVGRFRPSQSGKPIDPSGVLDDKPFAGPVELAGLMREHPAVDDCLVRGLYRYAMAHVETGGEEILIRRIVDGARTAPDKFRAMLMGVIASDGFRVAADQP